MAATSLSGCPRSFQRDSWCLLLLKGALVYEQLGYKAFGIPGKLAASCSITMQNIGGETSERFLFVTVLFSLGAE